MTLHFNALSVVKIFDFGNDIEVIIIYYNDIFLSLSKIIYKLYVSVVREMADLLSLDLVGKKLVTDQIVLTIGYDKENLENSEILKKLRGMAVPAAV